MTARAIEEHLLGETLESRMRALRRRRARAPGVSREVNRVVENVLRGRSLSRDEALRLADCSREALPWLCGAAAYLRDLGRGRTVSFSPKVFIPLTRLCRDECGYCAFRQSPGEAERLYMSLDEVVALARAAERLGCTEALFTLGERPEQRYPEARQWLYRNGYRTTIEYLHQACRRVLTETRLLPHSNPGTLSCREMQYLKGVNASMGLMLENVSERLCQEGGPHHRAPSKRPRVRLKVLRMAGELRIPFTTGLLVGMGETRKERIESLLRIRDLHQQYGHIQEVIIQPFRAKPDTPMASHPELSMDELLWTVAAARLILGPTVNLQVPPNLSATTYPLFLLAGINDWGGISPLTIDYVNPEAPWPQLSELRRKTEMLGFTLKPRPPVYPEYIRERTEYISESIKHRLHALIDEDGYIRGGIDRYVCTT
ncbi:MAG: 7,8-didemethyl-8-hydroxy-5-deazariboflavin synthase subunit CofG [Acidobacteria bacterium]|nr:MAG: 7,8-didemethyl-8-hydroxy-5-deazariboflavin synthase subunit CofG [Acidobacteriota bacterium]